MSEVQKCQTSQIISVKHVNVFLAFHYSVQAYHVSPLLQCQLLYLRSSVKYVVEATTLNNIIVGVKIFLSVNSVNINNKMVAIEAFVKGQRLVLLVCETRVSAAPALVDRASCRKST